MARRLCPYRLTYFRRNGLDRSEAQCSVPPAGSAHAHDGHVRAVDCLDHIRSCCQMPSSYRSLYELVYLALDDGRSARVYQIDLGRHLVCTDNRVATVRERGSTNCPHISKSEHAN